MDENYIRFVRNIYSYCDNNFGKKVLFPVFVNLWPELNFTVKKKDLVIYTSNIVSRLIDKKVLKEIPKKSEYHPYGIYRILKHKDLLSSNCNSLLVN